MCVADPGKCVAMMYGSLLLTTSSNGRCWVIDARHIGHLCTCSLHSRQRQQCLHGYSTTSRSRSKQTTHVVFQAFSETTTTSPVSSRSNLMRGLAVLLRRVNPPTKVSCGYRFFSNRIKFFISLRIACNAGSDVCCQL